MQFHLYYGEGKGKTTAALGQALRSWGHGWRVLFVQFLKDAEDQSGEVEAGQTLGRNWRLLRASLPCPVLKRPGPRDRERLRRTTLDLLEDSLREARAGGYDAVVFDEVLAAWKLGLLTVAQIRNAHGELSSCGTKLFVATGRWAPKSLIALADMVTEMSKIKHPFDRGQRAGHGIDY